MNPDADLLRRCALMHGAAPISSARAAGLTSKQVRSRVTNGTLRRPTARVLVDPGAPTTPLQHVAIAVLDAGPDAVVCGTTAIALWGLPGFDLRPIHLARPRGLTSRRSTMATVHEVLDLLPHHLTVLDGIPIVRPERAIFELCGFAHPDRAERALDNAWTKGLLSGRSLRKVHAELTDRGRAGTVALRLLLEDRPDSYIPPASNLERRFMQILADHGEPAMRRQVDTGGDRWIGRVDFRSDRLPLIVEVQSERYHSALCDQRDDAARIAALADAGFEVVEVTDIDVWHHPLAVVQRVRDARRRLSATVG